MTEEATHSVTAAPAHTHSSGWCESGVLLMRWAAQQAGGLRFRSLGCRPVVRVRSLVTCPRRATGLANGPATREAAMDSVRSRWTTPRPRPFTPGGSPPTSIEEWIRTTGDTSVDAAWRLIRHASPVLLTGAAGTGKSHFISLYRRQSAVRTVVLAPTGIAARNVQGQTLHSFFRLPPRVLLPSDTVPTERMSLYNAVDEIIVDETSMARADLIDAMDRILRQARASQAPFGGLRLVFVGDPLQLPPIVSGPDRRVWETSGYPGPWFFQSRVLQDVGLRVAALDRIHRQKDRAFAEILSRVRQGHLSDADRFVLNQRVRPPDGRTSDPPLVLTATRKMAKEVNAMRLAALRGREATYVGQVLGSFPRSALPAPRRFAAKVGARVMFIRNDTSGRWVNGSTGTVAALGQGEIAVSLDAGETHRVQRVTWEWIRYTSAHDAGRWVPEVVGRYTQLPCVLAWAATIHKVQGMSLDRVRVDLGSGTFSPGHAYVALSRSRTLQGLELARPIKASDVWADPAVMDLLANGAPRRGDDAA